MSSELATIIGSIIGSAAVIGTALIALIRRLRPIVHVMDDLVGEAARPGVPRQPGLVERMTTNEQLARQALGQATETKKATHRVEDLLLRHMVNTSTLQEVYLHNNARLHTALSDVGVEVTDLREYPPVDTGDEPPHNRRSTDV